MKAIVAAFNQEKALVGAFSVITNLRMELFEALAWSRHWPGRSRGYSADRWHLIQWIFPHNFEGQTSGSWVEYLCSQAVIASRSQGGIFVTLTSWTPGSFSDKWSIKYNTYLQYIFISFNFYLDLMIAQAKDCQGKPHSHYSCPYQTKTDWWSVMWRIYLSLSQSPPTGCSQILLTKQFWSSFWWLQNQYVKLIWEYIQCITIKAKMSRHFHVIYECSLRAYKMALFICNVKNSRYLSIYYGFFKRRLFPLRHCRHSEDRPNVYRIERVASLSVVSVVISIALFQFQWVWKLEYVPGSNTKISRETTEIILMRYITAWLTTAPPVPVQCVSLSECGSGLKLAFCLFLVNSYVEYLYVVLRQR